MSDYSISLKPVYSSPADAMPQGVAIPQGWSLAWHQVATLEALRDPIVDVVFNTAVTGDGKSLAAYLEVLQGECSAIGLYPTNELARDQEIQTRHYIEQFQPHNDPPD
jgi:CRISPR-associated endonuclease/helicase Cas3